MNIAGFFAYGKGVFEVGREQRVRIEPLAVGSNEPTYEAVTRVGFHLNGNACIVGQIDDIKSVFGNALAYELARTLTFYSRTDDERIVKSRINGSVFGYGELDDFFVGNKRGGFAFAVVPADEFEVNGFFACRNFNLGTLGNHKLQLFFGGRISFDITIVNVSVFARDNGQGNLFFFGKLRVNIGVVGYRKGFGRIRRIEAFFFVERVDDIPAGKPVSLIGYSRQCERSAEVNYFSVSFGSVYHDCAVFLYHALRPVSVQQIRIRFGLGYAYHERGTDGFVILVSNDDFMIARLCVVYLACVYNVFGRVENGAVVRRYGKPRQIGFFFGRQVVMEESVFKPIAGYVNRPDLFHEYGFDMHVFAVLAEYVFGFRRNGFFGKIPVFVYRIPAGKFISFGGFCLQHSCITESEII